MGPFCSCWIDKSSEYGPESGLDLSIHAERVAPYVPGYSNTAAGMARPARIWGAGRHRWLAPAGHGDLPYLLA